MLAEMISASGAIVQWGGWTGFTWAWPQKITAKTTAGDYSKPFMDKEINAGGTAWVSTIPAWGDWELTANGWVEWLGQAAMDETLHNNNDGTLSVAGPSLSYTLSSIVKTDLTGLGVICNYDNTTVAGEATVVCATPGNFPSGAAAYSATRTYTSDYYVLYDGAAQGATDVLTNTAGVAMTALPTIGTTACINGVVYVPISPTPATGLNNYNIHPTSDGTCRAGVITTAMAAPANSTTLVASKTVNGVVMLTVTQGTLKRIAAFNAQAGNRFMVGDQVRTFWDTVARTSVNKIAANAQLAAHGLPVLP